VPERMEADGRHPGMAAGSLIRGDICVHLRHLRMNGRIRRGRRWTQIHGEASAWSP
jgi:hypothetical protein